MKTVQHPQDSALPSSLDNKNTNETVFADFQVPCAPILLIHISNLGHLVSEDLEPFSMGLHIAARRAQMDPNLLLQRRR